jgi:predicted dinucleotide-binding enzyme
LSDSRRRQLIENEFPNTRDIVILAVPYPALADIAGSTATSSPARSSSTSHPTTVLLAGDDTDAKNALAAAITAGGVVTIDAGPLENARELEAIGFLQIQLAVSQKIGFTGGFSLTK